MTLGILSLLKDNSSFNIFIAQTTPAPSGIAKSAGYNDADVEDTALSKQVGRIIRISMTLVGTIFFALTVYAGILWMTASGNDEKVQESLKILKMAIMGLIITVSAYSITLFVTTSAF